MLHPERPDRVRVAGSGPRGRMYYGPGPLMRAPVDTIAAPPFPARLPWVNVAPLRMDKQIGRPVLIEFWDFCRPNSLHTLPYVQAWHERYEAAGLRVISVHAAGFPPGHDEDAVRAAVARLGIEHPVVLDPQLEIWTWFANRGWPSRYLFDQQGKLFEYHHGEGDYHGTERAIQELLGVEREPVPYVRPQDDPAAMVVVPTADVEGAYSGPYEAGEVWAVVSGAGALHVDGRTVAVEHPGAVLLVEHDRHTEGVLALEPGDGVTVHATCFGAGLAA